MAIPELFSDGLSDITFSGGAVRMVLAGLSAEQRDDQGRPRPEPRQVVIMTVEGFLQSLATMSRIAQQLEQAGIVQRQAPAPVPVSGPARPQSPNFP